MMDLVCEPGQALTLKECYLFGLKTWLQHLLETELGCSTRYWQHEESLVVMTVPRLGTGTLGMGTPGMGILPLKVTLWEIVAQGLWLSCL